MMRFVDIYSRFMDILEKIIKVIVVIVFVLMSIIAIVEVCRRYFFGLSFQWSGELSRFLLVWLTFIGGSVAFRGNSLVRFDLGHNKLNEKARNILSLIVDIICLAFIVGIFFRALSYTFSPVLMNQISLATGLPMAAVYTSIPLGFAAMILFGIERLANTVIRMTNVTEGQVRGQW